MSIARTIAWSMRENTGDGGMPRRGRTRSLQARRSVGGSIVTRGLGYRENGLEDTLFHASRALRGTELTQRGPAVPFDTDTYILTGCVGGG